MVPITESTPAASSALLADGLRLQVNALDYTLLIGYFLIVIGIGLAARRAIATSEDFFLSGRSLPGWITGLAFISANLGAIEVLGNAANGAQYGISTVHFYWIGAVPAMLFLALVMMPFYYGSKVHSVPEYLRRRFGPGAHLFNGLSFAAAGVLIAGVNLYALAIVIKALLGWPTGIAIVVAGAVVLAYIGVGGLSGAIYNEVLQFFVIVAGLVPLVVVGLVHIGGFHGLSKAVSDTGPLHGKALATWAGTNVGHPTNPLGDWIGIVVGLGFVLSFGYWTTNFAEVQRALSAKDLSAARRTSLIGAFPKIFIPILTVIPGLLALALLKDKIGPGGTYTYNEAIPYLVGEFLPNGVLGIALTGLLAAFMAGMAANISSFNTVWTYDVWRPYVVKDREDAYYLRHGRIMTVVGIVISIGTAFIASSYDNLFNYIQLLFSFFNAPLFATFLLGLFWKRMTAAGGVWGLAAGTAGALIAHFVYVGASFLGHPEPFLTITSGQSQNFYGAIIAFAADLVVSVVVSLFTKPKTSAELEGLVWGQAPTNLEDTGAEHWYTNVWWLSGIAVILTVGMSVATVVVL
ncbi:MAG: sodium:solute symporter [Pseudonocardiales bacterium]|nr:sodium:solute symporter [Pseudonocardiales bacterium]